MLFSPVASHPGRLGSKYKTKVDHCSKHFDTSLLHRVQTCWSLPPRTVPRRAHECFMQAFFISHGRAHENIRLTGNPQVAILPAG